MKTTDGHEASKGSYYFLEDGQSVILEEAAITKDEKQVFLVTPFYEGEAMSVNGDGGTHNEITTEYEHEGELTLVKAIFAKAPLKKLDTQYKSELVQIEQLSLSIGEIKKHSIKLINEKAGLEVEIKQLSKTCETSKENDLQARNMFNSTTEEVNKKRQELSGLEDSISSIKPEDKHCAVNNGELQRLNKRSFKLQCLEAGGVDNWEWYSESLKDFDERYPEG